VLPPVVCHLWRAAERQDRDDDLLDRQAARRTTEVCPPSTADSVDLLGQNLGRFQESGLAPAAQNYTDILDPAINIKKQPHIVFCKKNARDLQKPK
jgi:hypothetical protein